MDFRLPNDSERATIMGSTGSGKTQAGLWQLSLRSWSQKPWVVVDYKRDELIGSIPGLEEIRFDRKPPKHAGIYAIRPMPNDVEAVEDFLWKVWHRGRIGLFVDEGYMLAKSPAYRAILTQGRSKRIPVITLAQRPVWLDRFTISEAEHLQIFRLNDVRDRDVIQGLIPFDVVSDVPDPFHSWWYDVKRNFTFALEPVPDWNTIRENFAARRPRRHWI